MARLIYVLMTSSLSLSPSSQHILRSPLFLLRLLLLFCCWPHVPSPFKACSHTGSNRGEKELFPQACSGGGGNEGEMSRIADYSLGGGGVLFRSVGAGFFSLTSSCVLCLPVCRVYSMGFVSACFWLVCVCINVEAEDLFLPRS